MGKLIRGITADGTISFLAADTTDIVNTAQEIHVTSAVTSAALGRLLTAAVFLGSVRKADTQSVTLRIRADGPAGVVLAVSDAHGNVRGYIENPVVEIPRNAAGKLDVAGAVGRNGTLSVSRDLGHGEPYVGQVPLISGEIAADVAQYYAASEQIPTVCALGVLVNPQLDIRVAGGYLIQPLPGAEESVLAKIERGVASVPPITEMLDSGLSPLDVCRNVLPDFALNVLEERDISYRCNCSTDRVTRALVSLGVSELEALAQEEQVEVNCQFCAKHYHFSPEEITALRAIAKPKP